MPKMQVANCTVRLAGDAGNTVAKYGVTVSEIVVLQKIHGNDAIVDIKPTGEVETTSRAEHARLHHVYGSPQDDGSRRSRIVDLLFPGAAAPMFQTFRDAEIDEDYFVPGTVEPAPPAEAAPTEAAAPAVEAEAEEDDGISDMPTPAKADDAPDSLFK